MSVPNEEKESLKLAWKFLFELLDKKKTPKVPLAVRFKASHVLRHYPGPVTIDLFYKRDK